MGFNALRAKMRRSARYRDTLLAAVVLWLSGVLWVVLAARAPWWGWLQMCAAALLVLRYHYASPSRLDEHRDGE